MVVTLDNSDNSTNQRVRRCRYSASLMESVKRDCVKHY
jgi:hypothetical protein